MGNGELWSIHRVHLCYSFLPVLFLPVLFHCSSAGPSLGLQSLKDCSTMVPAGKASLRQCRCHLWMLCAYLIHTDAKECKRTPALMPRAPPPVSHAGAHSAVFSLFFPLSLTLLCNVLLSVKYAFTEVPPAWLSGVLQWVRCEASCVWHRMVCDLFSQRPPLMLTL